MVAVITTFNHLENKVAQPHCFTLRLPQDIYIEVFELSQAQGKTMNATVIDLIKIAMSQKVSVRRALEALLDREFPNDAITSES
jgi:hypothetical protein